jgi:hypothetical protein
MSFSGVNYLAILVAAIAGWLVGAGWYMALSKADAHRHRRRALACGARGEGCDHRHVRRLSRRRHRPTLG